MELQQTALGGYQPRCIDCGVALCWEIDPIEYIIYHKFWDNWKCEHCNPEYRGAYQRYKDGVDKRDTWESVLSRYIYGEPIDSFDGIGPEDLKSNSKDLT